MEPPNSAIAPEQTCLKQEIMVFAPSAKTLKHNLLPLNPGQTSITPHVHADRSKSTVQKWERHVSCPASGRDGFHAVPDQTLGRTKDRTGVLANADASAVSLLPASTLPRSGD